MHAAPEPPRPLSRYAGASRASGGQGRLPPEDMRCGCCTAVPSRRAAFDGGGCIVGTGAAVRTPASAPQAWSRTDVSVQLLRGAPIIAVAVTSSSYRLTNPWSWVNPTRSGHWDSPLSAESPPFNSFNMTVGALAVENAQLSWSGPATALSYFESACGC